MSFEEAEEEKAVDLGWLFGAPQLEACHDKRATLKVPRKRKVDCNSIILEEEDVNPEFGDDETQEASPPEPVQVKSSEPLPPWWVLSRLVSPKKKAKQVQEEADIEDDLTDEYEPSIETDTGDSISTSEGDTHHSVASTDSALAETEKRPLHEYQVEEVTSSDGTLLPAINEDSQKRAEALNNSATLESRKRPSRKRPAQEYPSEQRHAKQLAKKSPNTGRQESDDKISIPCDGKSPGKSSPTTAAKAPVVSRNGRLADEKSPRKSSSTVSAKAPVVPRNGTLASRRRSTPKVPTPMWPSSTIEEVGSDDIPLDQLANYPQYLKTRTSKAGTRKCVMCSVEALFVPSKKYAGKASPLIVQPSTRVCNGCWETVWEIAGMHEFYCCHACGHWRPWAAFRGRHKMMKLCLPCRTPRQKNKPTPQRVYVLPFRPCAAAGAPSSIENPVKTPQRDADMLLNDTEQHRKQLDEMTIGVSSVGKGAPNSSVSIRQILGQDSKELNGMINGVSNEKQAQNSEEASKRVAPAANPSMREDNSGKVSQRDSDMFTNDTEQHRKQLGETTNGVSVGKEAPNSAAASKRVAFSAVASPSVRKGNSRKASQHNAAIAINDAEQDTDQHDERMNGVSVGKRAPRTALASQRISLAAAANPRIRCVQVLPTPRFCSSTVDSRWTAPRFRDLVNYPALLWQRASESSTKVCLMCGIECPLVDHGDPGIRENNDGIGVILQFEKSVCSLCQVGVWNMKGSEMQIKWCTTCFDFRPWGCFHVIDSGEMKELNTCVVCRDSSKKRIKSDVQAASDTTETADESLATSTRVRGSVASRPTMQWDAR